MQSFKTIEIQNITKSYKHKIILKDASLRFEEGHLIGLTGDNGSGKSTLLEILAGVSGCESGDFLYDGESLFANEAARTSLVGYLPQNSPLIPELTALDNLLLWYDRSEVMASAENGLLHELGIDAFLKVPVRKLSGGMAKRLMLGCVTLKKPRILLMDEPSSALDLSGKIRMFDYLKTYVSAGNTVLLVSHDMHELNLCDYTYILKDGIIRSFESSL